MSVGSEVVGGAWDWRLCLQPREVAGKQQVKTT